METTKEIISQMETDVKILKDQNSQLREALRECVRTFTLFSLLNHKADLAWEKAIAAIENNKQ